MSREVCSVRKFSIKRFSQFDLEPLLVVLRTNLIAQITAEVLNWRFPKSEELESTQVDSIRRRLHPDPLRSHRLASSFHIMGITLPDRDSFAKCFFISEYWSSDWFYRFIFRGPTR